MKTQFARKITLSDLNAASEATGQGLHETIDHMERGVDQVESQKLGIGRSPETAEA